MLDVPCPCCLNQLLSISVDECVPGTLRGYGKYEKVQPKCDGADGAPPTLKYALNRADLAENCARHIAALCGLHISD